MQVFVAADSPAHNKYITGALTLLFRGRPMVLSGL